MGWAQGRWSREGPPPGSSQATLPPNAGIHPTPPLHPVPRIQQKHKLIPQGGQVLDLGCHPGAWLQVACESLGPTKKGGRVIGVDLQETKRPDKYCDDRVTIVQVRRAGSSGAGTGAASPACGGARAPVRRPCSG